jgi:hypothetical protein
MDWNKEKFFALIALWYCIGVATFSAVLGLTVATMLEAFALCAFGLPSLALFFWGLRGATAQNDSIARFAALLGAGFCAALLLNVALSMAIWPNASSGSPSQSYQALMFIGTVIVAGYGAGAIMRLIVSRSNSHNHRAQAR